MSHDRKPDPLPPSRPLVWSSELLPARGTPSPDRAAPGPVPAPVLSGSVRVRLERQGRGGKVVSVVENLTGHPAAIEEIATKLKSACGAGGTVRGKTIEVQGDHRDRIVAVLATLGIAAKRAGG